MEENNDKEKIRRDRCRRRAERKAICRCEPKSRKKRSKLILSQNPFIIFYLEMYYQDPTKRVTEVAKQAGKEWCAMSEESRKKYIDLAAKEREKRSKGKRRRRRGC